MTLGGAAAPGSLRELAAVFGRLGLTAFGGPAAHVALFRQEFVLRRGWASEQRFLDLLGAANLLPGPTSTEVAMSIGHDRAGRRGLLVAGTMFILPASLLVLALAAVYVALGALPEVEWVLYGVQAVVLVVVLRAVVGIAPAALAEPMAWVIAAASVGLGLVGVHPLVALGLGAVAMLAARRLGGSGSSGVQALLVVDHGARGGVAAVAGAATVGLGSLFLTFLVIGTVSFGSGYLLLAFLREAFVVPGLLTDAQLLDAVAVGQVTPGPLFTTATFIGYLLAGVPGAVVATVAIFLPSFAFVALAHPLIDRLRSSRALSAALDGVNAAAIGLLVAVTIELGRFALTDVATVALAIVAGVLLWTDRASSVAVLVGGGVAGLLLGAVGLGP
jgi:chromate transporter